MITKNVKLYLGDGFPVRIPVSQYDTMWQFVFEIIHNSQPWQIPSGATAVLNGRKPDGNVFAFSGTIANNTVTVDADVQMTAVAGQTVCELSILADGKTVGTANFILDVEEAPKSADDVVSDTVLDGYGMMVTNAVDDWMNSHSGQIGGLTNEAKQALLTLLAHVAYTDDQGQTYLDALEDALYPPANLVSISAVFEQGSAVIYDTDSLDTLKQYLTVTANMSDGTTQTVSNYTLSGTLAAGTSTIVVSYGGKTTTFDVAVTHETVPSGYTAYDYITPLVSSNKGNCIVVDFAMSSDYVFETSFFYNNSTVVYSAVNVFGTKNGREKQFALFCTPDTGKLGYWYGGTDTTQTLTPLVVNSINQVKVLPVGKSSTYPTNAVLNVNGTDYTTGSTASGVTWSPWIGFFNYAVSASGTNAYAVITDIGLKIGETVIKDFTENTVLCDLIPANNGTYYGLYDRISKKFYYDSGHPDDYTCGNWE